MQPLGYLTTHLTGSGWQPTIWSDMGRHKKLEPVASEPAQEEDQATVDAMLDGELTRIKTLTASVSRTLEEGCATPALIRESNGLSAALAKVSAELRARDKHVRLRLDRLSAKDEDAIVAEYLQGLPRPRRNEFLELLKGLDGNNDLLSL